MSHIDEVFSAHSEYVQELMEEFAEWEEIEYGWIYRMVVGLPAVDPWFLYQEPKPEPRERTSLIAIEAGMRGTGGQASSPVRTRRRT